MIKVCNRVAGWNALRYKREYNHDLTVALLREELSETLEAVEDVDALDGLCDLVYVALGALWKCNIPADAFNTDEALALKLVEGLVSPYIQPVHYISAIISAHTYDNDLSIAVAMHAIVLLARAQMSVTGLTPEQHIEALNAVCDANDTKSQDCLKVHEKGFTHGKGAKFVAPEAALQLILNKRVRAAEGEG